MEPQTKRTILATVLCMTVFFGWIALQPNRPPPQTSPEADQTVGRTDEPDPTTAPESSDATSGGGSPRTVSKDATGETEPGSARFTVVGAAEPSSVTLGDDRQNDELAGFENPYEMKVVVSSRGAGVETVTLSRHRDKVPEDKKKPDHDPYNLLKPVESHEGGSAHLSFVIEKIRLIEEKHDVKLADIDWTMTDRTDGDDPETELSVVIKDGSVDVLRVTKTYRLRKFSHHLETSLTIANLTDRPRKVRITARGPIGVAPPKTRFDSTLVLTANIGEDGKVSLGEKTTRADAFKAPSRGVPLLTPEPNHVLWTALGNKYFACIIVPIPPDDGASYSPSFEKVSALALSTREDVKDDLTFEQVYSPKQAIAPGQTLTLGEEIFCGPKSTRLFDTMPDSVQARHYEISSYADRSACAPDVVSNVMLKLLTFLYGLVQNYGVAIILLVIVVRGVLHPISKRGQINMMKMQKNMARIKPKLESIQQQYKNDKQKLSEETQKLYREEGVNPAGSVMGCLPMVLQMPIWVALWTTLNTNVDMRHMPFFGYIRDLASADALIMFSAPIEIPLISMMIGPVHSFNLLPILMSGVMFAQQKITQKLTKPDKPVAPKLDKDGNALPDTMAQQQKMMSFMMIMMGVFFYNFPSGLCLYILSSSLLGMFEQIYIKKHIREQEARGDFEAKVKAPKKQGWLSRKLGDAQKMAEQQRLAQATAPRSKDKAGRKKPRF
jgi:YidC/Oxa1 family membrane protein insertase